MSTHRIGYARVSTRDQNLGLQRDALQAGGCARDLGMSRATLYRRIAEADARHLITSGAGRDGGPADDKRAPRSTAGPRSIARTPASGSASGKTT